MVCKLEGCGLHNAENRIWLGMSASWTVRLTSRWGARQTRHICSLWPQCYLYSPVSSPAPIFVTELACFSHGNFVLTICVYKYVSFFGNALPVVFSIDLYWSLIPTLSLLCCQPGSSSPHCFAVCDYWVGAICHISGCSLVLTVASVCLHWS